MRLFQETTLRVRALIAVTVLACASSAGAFDKLLVSGFNSDAVHRFKLVDDSPIGTLTGTTLDGPQATVLGPDGLLYVADEGNNRVVRYNPETSTFFDVFIAPGSGGLDGPTGLLFTPSGDLLVGSFNTDRILGYDGATGAPFAEPFDPTNTCNLNGPDVGMTIGPDGHLYVPSFFNNRVLRYNITTGACIDTFITGGLITLPQPRTIIFRPDGFVYISSDSGDKVVRFDASTGAVDSEFIPAGTGGLDGASGMVFGDDGFLYVTSWRTNEVLRFNASNGAYVNDAVEAADGVIAPTFISILEDPVVPVPATSEWGLFVLSLTVLAGGSCALRRRAAVRFGT